MSHFFMPVPMWPCTACVCDSMGSRTLGISCGFYKANTQIVCDSIGTRMDSCPIFFMPVPMWHRTACACDSMGSRTLGISCGFYKANTQLVWSPIGTRMNSCPIFFMPVPMWHRTACVCDPHGSPRGFINIIAKRLPAGAVPRCRQREILFANTSCCRQSAGPERPGQCRNIPLARC